MTTTERIEKFKKIVDELGIDIKDDAKWPVIFEQILIDVDDLDQRYQCWSDLLVYFKKKEEKLNHCHKGLIYWNLGIIDLINGKINDCISNLELSSSEDKYMYLDPKRPSASMGLLAVIKPLLHKYDVKEGAPKFRKELHELYISLDQYEKKNFADLFLKAHDSAAFYQFTVIKDDFFTFIQDEKIRVVAKDIYDEIVVALSASAQVTFATQIFGIGSVSEAVIDDLFQRDDQKFWKLFHQNSEIKNNIDENSRLNEKIYPAHATLGQKIQALKMMIEAKICPISKESVLILSIIGEYRDLIHPKRAVDFEFKRSRYVGMVLLSIFTHIAGSLWPEQIKKQISSHKEIS